MMISRGIGDTVNEVQKNNRGGTGRVSPAEDNPGSTEKMGLNLYNFLQSEPADLIKINDNGLKTELTNNNVSHWRVSIPRPADYKSAALPTELQWHHRANIWYKINLSMGIKQWAIL